MAQNFQDGPQFKELKKLAGRNVEFTGKVNFQKLKELLQKAKAFIFAAEEDFGIAPVEAQACGVPVIAYGKGGALETVVKDKTGIFFHSQTPRAVAEAVKEFEQKEELFDPRVIKKNAERFSASRFRREIKEFILEKVEEFKGEALPPRG
nr:glycosyltransferase [Thermovibrio ammonificans]